MSYVWCVAWSNAILGLFAKSDNAHRRNVCWPISENLKLPAKVSLPAFLFRCGRHLGTLRSCRAKDGFGNPSSPQLLGESEAGKSHIQRVTEILSKVIAGMLDVMHRVVVRCKKQIKGRLLIVTLAWVRIARFGQHNNKSHLVNMPGCATKTAGDMSIRGRPRHAAAASPLKAGARLERLEKVVCERERWWGWRRRVSKRKWHHRTVLQTGTKHSTFHAAQA
jgi:hypothetical protein